MERKHFKIGSRGSQLALHQTNFIKMELEKLFPDHIFDVEVIKTKGDKILDVALSKIGDKGLFTKELEEKLMDLSIDCAVHSLKDIPTQLPPGLVVGAICDRHIAEDCVVMNPKHSGKTIDMLPAGSIIGSSSLRRIAQLRRTFPTLVFKDVRGNLNTRLKKLDDGEYDALILAVAGLTRLGLDDRISQTLPTSMVYYAVGQGALAIECRADDDHFLTLLNAINHPPTRAACDAERSFLRGVEGGCQIPVGVWSTVNGDDILLRGMPRPSGCPHHPFPSITPMTFFELALR
eukprot:TRINITY_DN3265_c0_g2_i2.p1 TRINITY_DN3265_c0_g2~~TRINITY_DN3265_c0_g2_i2.p1  ORF type:complete len:301 (+),score=66.21 TRINITY_DN3265_c0_g2_i2:31-903(+)